MKRIYLSLSLLLLVIIGSRAANFKFAFLTDIHITAGDSIPYNDLARSVMCISVRNANLKFAALLPIMTSNKSERER